MKISICMMVKNEEEMLPRCLESVKWADELIVVDTGSTDKTVEIAKSYGAYVHHHPWQNDFSVHRNQSIKYATGDWICIIDADEEIVSDMTNMKERLNRIPPHITALVVRVRELRGDDETSWLGMRFFRKSSGIHYKNAVHNKAVFDGLAAGTDIEFRHYGYSLDPEKMAKKRERTESLLMKRIEADENDHAAYYYMTQMRIGQKRYDEAIKFGNKFFDKVTVGPTGFQFYGVMYFYMAWAYMKIGDGGMAWSWTEKGLEFFPDDLDLNYMMARIGYESAHDDVLKEYSDRYLELLPKYENMGKIDTDKFEIKIDDSYWKNRTIYTAAKGAQRALQEMRGVL